MRAAENYYQADQLFSHYVGLITPEQWSKTVPATPDWSVRDLVNHVTQNNFRLMAALEGSKDEAPEDMLGGDSAAGWIASADTTEELANIETKDDRMVTHLHFGEIAVGALLAGETVDRLIHSWDLANALGADEDLPLKLVQTAYDTLLPNVDNARAAGYFGPEVTVGEDATLQQKLLALTGRNSGYEHHEPDGSHADRAEVIHRSS